MSSLIPNIAKLEWQACSPDMNPIDHASDTLKTAVFGRDDPQTTQWSSPICCWEVGQSGPTGPWWTSGQYATSNRGMHQCKRTCYWVLEVLVYAATWHTNSKVKLYYCTTCNFWFSWAIQRAEMLFLSISIPFICNCAGTLRTEVMQNIFWRVYYIGPRLQA